MIGGSAPDSGAIGASGSIGSVRIAHDLIGGGALDAGALGAQDSIASIIVGGSVRAGLVPLAGTIGAGDAIGNLRINGSVIGSTGAEVIIGARGQAAPTATTDVAIKNISIKGRVEHAIIAAGWDVNASPVNGNAQIGKVTVGGDWIASSLLAGALNLGADDLPGGSGANADNANFGDSDDHLMAGGTIAGIAKIVIGGQMQGTIAAGDHFGIVSHTIGSLTVHGMNIPLTTGLDNVPLGATGDLTVHEIS